MTKHAFKYLGQRPVSRKNMHLNISAKGLYQEQIKAFGQNIELRVKLAYVFNILPYGI